MLAKFKRTTDLNSLSEYVYGGNCSQLPDIYKPRYTGTYQQLNYAFDFETSENKTRWIDAARVGNEMRYINDSLDDRRKINCAVECKWFMHIHGKLSFHCIYPIFRQTYQQRASYYCAVQWVACCLCKLIN